MRANIKDLKIEEIYNDYQLLKSINEKYYYCGNSTVFDKAAEGLMTVLKNEITRRKLEELETNHDFKSTQKESEELGEYKNATTTITSGDVTDCQQYTTTYSQNDNGSGDVYLFGLS